MSSDVVNLSDVRFSKSNVGKIIKLCNSLDDEVQRLLFVERIPADEVLVALCQRIGVYLSCTDANKEKVVKKLSKIIYKYSKL